MISAQDITYFFGLAATVWMLGFSWGKGVVWLRNLVNAA